MARQGSNIISFDDARRYASSHSSAPSRRGSSGRSSASSHVSRGSSDFEAFAPADAFDDLVDFQSPFASSRFDSSRGESSGRREARRQASARSSRAASRDFSSVSRSGRIAPVAPSWYDEEDARASFEKTGSRAASEDFAPRAAVESYSGSEGEELEGSLRDSRRDKRKQRLKGKAEKMFARQFGGSDGASETGPRAAVYKGEMGRSHKRAFAEMGGTQRDGRSSSRSNAAKAKKMRSATAVRLAIAAGCLVCVAAVVLFLYPTARQVYIESRQEDRLQAEYDALVARNDAMQERIDYLKTDEGIEDAARQQLGWVKEGETAVVVKGLSEDSEAEDSSVNIQVVSGSVPAPQTWYSPVLDVVFGYSDPATAQKGEPGEPQSGGDSSAQNTAGE